MYLILCLQLVALNKVSPSFTELSINGFFALHLMFLCCLVHLDVSHHFLICRPQNQFAALNVPKKDSSQIEGPSIANSYGFKISMQNLQDAKALHEVSCTTYDPPFFRRSVFCTFRVEDRLCHYILVGLELDFIHAY